MRSMFIIAYALTFACGGEPFTEGADVSGTRVVWSGMAGVAGMQMPPMPASSGGSAGQLPVGVSGGTSFSEAGASSVGGSYATEPTAGGSPPSEPVGNEGGSNSTWLCRTDGDLCQCYVDPSVFEPGWLTDDKCSKSIRCTIRDSSACVCWGTDSDYLSALTVPGTVKVESCPTITPPI